jgi:hypothetical protein
LHRLNAFVPGTEKWRRASRRDWVGEPRQPGAVFFCNRI